MSKKIPLDVVDDAGNSYYVSERKIYAREVSGRFDRLRKVAVWVLLGMFYVFPWINWDARQSVLFDLPARKFYVLGLTFWPQDFIFLALLLVMAGLALFFFTALAGRLWCGYACPQTVWTEIFMWIENVIEGDRGKRMKLDRMPWNREKILKKGGKHFVWLVFALWTGFTFVGFFTPIRDLAARAPFVASGWQWGGWESFWVFFYALATWGFAGFMREQVCKYMCPYARFQSAMFDRNTLIIAYDPMRGEPRGPRKRGLGSVLERGRGLIDKVAAYDFVFRASGHAVAADAAAQARGHEGMAAFHPEREPLPKFPPDELGDCIDCTICVQVCPTGIDIRNGLQYECIACGACIDACDDVMDKMGYPHGLIRYSTQNAIDSKMTHVLRPRVILYGLLLGGIFAAWLWGVTHRTPLIVEAIRDRNALYRVVEDGQTENGYTLRVVNKDSRERSYTIDIKASDGIALVGGPLKVKADGEEVLTLPVNLRAPAEVRGQKPVTFEVKADDGSVSKTVDSNFFGPM
ncbi:4Fe-4S binding protein [Lysobacter pythonis]|uniref:4Fe-4S binding protein n=1 Tax=Solilutibacter pythonis TaxID=2483112 RepID=A0A3M2I3P9_9GAMM|nr:4Fe-4S dicluster domain-containing protein [Lysobacter pythonis]RMH93842.1 4Fe-4S binding protein [Lysobacter pythonis]